MSFIGNCLKFPHDQANVIGFRRKITEVNSYLYYTITKVYMINTITSINLLTWLKEYLSGLSTVGFTFFPPFHIILWKKVTMHSLEWRSGSYVPLPWWLNIYTNYFGFYCTRDLSMLSILFFTQSFISSWTNWHLFYILGYNPLYFIYFVGQIVPVLDLSVDSYVSLKYNHQWHVFGLFFEYFLTF